MRLFALILQAILPFTLFARNVDLAVFQVITISQGSYRNRAVLSYYDGHPSVIIETIQAPLDDGSRGKIVKSLNVSNLKGGKVLGQEGDLRELRWEEYGTLSFIIARNKKCKISNFDKKNAKVICSKIK